MEENKVEDKTEKTFKERYLAGEIEFEEIDRYISRWNNSDDERTLAVYLGLMQMKRTYGSMKATKLFRRCWISRKPEIKPSA